jgi:hypothetical protein
MKTRNVDSIVNEIYTCLPNDRNKFDRIMNNLRNEIIGDYSSTEQTITINQNEDRLFFSGLIEIEASSIEENTFLFNAGHYRYDGVRRGRVYDYVTLPPIGNTKIKKNSVWKTVLAWVKKNGLWKRCIVWKKINGVWKK